MKTIVWHVGHYDWPEEQEDWVDDMVREVKLTFAQFYEMCMQGARTEAGTDGLLHVYQVRA